MLSAEDVRATYTQGSTVLAEVSAAVLLQLPSARVCLQDGCLDLFFLMDSQLESALTEP